MSYPPGASRSCHEADGRSDRSGGSGGVYSSGPYGTIPSQIDCGDDNRGGKLPIPIMGPCSYETGSAPRESVCTTNWKNWSLGLDYLLRDSEGVDLFKTFLQYEGCSNLLDFWFACQGFRSKVDPSDNRKITQLIKAIYRTYIRGSSSHAMGLHPSSIPHMPSSVLMLPNSQTNRTEPIRLRTETKRMITERISRKHDLDQTVFDSAQAEVEQFLRTTAYPSFLKSDVYVDFLQTRLNDSVHRVHFASGPRPTMCPSSSSSSVREGMTLTCVQPTLACSMATDCNQTLPLVGTTLPTVEEDHELQSEEFTRQDASSTLIRAPPPPCAMRPTQCPHCSVYHSHGHQPTNSCCPGYIQSSTTDATRRPFPRSSPRPIYYPMLTTGTPAVPPLTVENIQMTRFYRAELSLAQRAASSSWQSATPWATPQPIPTSLYESSLDRYGGGSHMVTAQSNQSNTRTADSRGRMSYAYAHWPDTVCPSFGNPAATTDVIHPAAGSGELPSRPPNPYHISYAPVSARDSERHSLSSEARTDDTHSHTDSSSHDGGAGHRWHCRYRQHRYPGRVHSTEMPTSVSTKPPPPQPPLASMRSPPTDPPDTSLTCHAPQMGPNQPRYTTTTTTTAVMPADSVAPIVPNQDPRKSTQQHHSRHTRRLGHGRRPPGLLMATSKSGDRTRTTAPDSQSPWAPQRTIAAKVDVGAAPPPLVTDQQPAKPAGRSFNLAERDPKAFFQLLEEKLERVLDDQRANDHLEQVMLETTSKVHSTLQQSNTISPETEKLAISSPPPVSTSSPPPPSLPAVPRAGQPMAGISTTTVLETATTAMASAKTRKPAPALLQRPWADRLLAAARVQHEHNAESAQSILEDHCSRIWATSADGTPPSNGSGDGGVESRTEPVPTTSAIVEIGQSHEDETRPAGMHCLQTVVITDHHDPLTFPVRRQLTTMGTHADDGQTVHSWVCSEPPADRAPLCPDSTLLQSTLQTDDASTELNVNPNFRSESPRLTGQVPILPSDRSMLVEAMASVGMVATSPSQEGSMSQGTTTTTMSSTTMGSAIGGSQPTNSSSSSSGCSLPLVIGYYLGDDPVPYRSVWPSGSITLAQFKQLIPKKKGPFRYFFKTFSNEFGSGVVHQEIADDCCILPIWEGKVVARVERIE